jgi:hypothetical protein
MNLSLWVTFFRGQAGFHQPTNKSKSPAVSEDVRYWKTLPFQIVLNMAM